MKLIGKRRLMLKNIRIMGKEFEFEMVFREFIKFFEIKERCENGI